MSKSNNFETDLLKKVLQGVALPWDGNAALYVSLHTADPGEDGTQATSEATYSGYARVAITRDAGGWTVASGQGQNAAATTFPVCTAGSNVLTHFGIGTAATGAGALIYSGALISPLAVSLNITPAFAAGQLAVAPSAVVTSRNARTPSPVR